MATKWEEGTVEEDILAQVYCPAIKKDLIIQDCNKETCENHGGVRKEPIIQIDEKGDSKQIGMKASVICHYPELISVRPLCRLPRDGNEAPTKDKEDKGKE